MARHTLPYLAAAGVSGPDAAAFLHAQLSADITGLADGEASFACYCSPRGQVIGLLLVCRRGNEFLMAGSAELLPGILDRLRLFVLRARVELVPAEDLIVLGLADLPASCSANNAWSTASGLSYGFSKRAGGSGDAAAADADGAAEWKVRELQHGVAWLGPRTRERFIPQMLGFDRLGAVSFSKGCYPGQEVIARAKYLGKVKRGPLRLVLETPDGADVAVTERVEAGAGVMLIAAQQRLEATLIDHAPLAENAQTLLLVVAPQAEDAVGSIEIGDRAYRCATI